MMQLFPQIDPWNVWNLPLSLWEVMAAMTDDFIAKSKEVSSRG